ncbi:hypothetical protein H5410_023784, partial [Solanum commersonii]
AAIMNVVVPFIPQLSDQELREPYIKFACSKEGFHSKKSLESNKQRDETREGCKGGGVENLNLTGRDIQNYLSTKRQNCLEKGDAQLMLKYFPRKSKRKSLDVIYSHHLRVDICYVFINLHLQELNNCFNAVSSDLLLGMTSLNSASSFGGFDKNRIMILTEYYKNEFDSNKLRDLSC